MEPSILPILENNLTPLIVWVLVYYTMVKGLRRDLQDIRDKMEK